MKTIKAALLGVVSTMWATGAYADAPVALLARACAEYPGDSAGASLCVGYVSGVVDAYRVLNKLAPTQGAMFCMSNSVTTDSIIQTVKNDILRHPEQSSTQAASFILGAITDTFPCK